MNPSTGRRVSSDFPGRSFSEPARDMADYYSTLDKKGSQTRQWPCCIIFGYAGIMHVRSANVDTV